MDFNLKTARASTDRRYGLCWHVEFNDGKRGTYPSRQVGYQWTNQPRDMAVGWELTDCPDCERGDCFGHRNG